MTYPIDGLTPIQEDILDSIEGLGEGQIPSATGAGDLEYSGATKGLVDEEVTFDKSISVPQASVKISDVVSISEATFTTFVRDNVSDENSISATSIIDDTGTDNLKLLAANSKSTIIAQPDFSTEFNTNPFSAPLSATLSNQTDAVTIKVASAMPNTRITITDNVTGRVVKYIPSKAAVLDNYDEEINPTGTRGIDLIAGDNRIDFNNDLADVPASGLFYLGFTPLRQFAGQASTFKIEADSVSILGEAGGIPFFQNEIQFLHEETIPFTSDITQLEDNYTRLNIAYTGLGASEGGFTVTSKSTGLSDVVTAGQFIAGDDGVSNPTVITDGSETFAQDDLVQISGSKFNNCEVEVESHIGNLLTIRGVGITSRVESFTRGDFITTVDSATLTKVEVAVKRFGESGKWEVATGSETPLAYHNEGYQLNIERLLDAESAAASQEPTGTGVANFIEAEFGPAQGTISDPVMIDADGTVKINEAGTYRIKVAFQFGRVGAGGVSLLLFRVRVNGAQAGRSIAVRIENSNTEQYLENDSWLTLPAGTELRFDLMRDASGNNSGGLFQVLPTVEAGSWNSSPSASIRIERWT